jgi:hypothetical protein
MMVGKLRYGKNEFRLRKYLSRGASWQELRLRVQPATLVFAPYPGVGGTMSILKWAGPCLIAALTASSPLQAHHSFPATYFVDQRVEIEGTVVQFLFRNPHSFVHVLAPDKDGVMQRWAVEWGASGALSNDNISSDTLKPGDKVKVIGAPARSSEDHRLRMSSIERLSDHWKWSGTFG